MIDAHTHILPEIDDGAPDVSVSRAMLERLAVQGVTVACLTPHYSPSDSLEDFLLLREKSFRKIKDFGPEFNIRFSLGSETFLTAELLSKPKEYIEQLCLNGTKLLLVEFPYTCAFGDRTMYFIEALICDFEIKPVLAHIERYKALMSNESVLDELIDKGCVAQINLNSIRRGTFIAKRKLLRFIRDGKARFVGTDCHNMTSRPPEYKTNIDIIVKKLGERFVRDFHDSMERLIAAERSDVNA
ncbi:MAG: hypothetical protein LBL35_01240 [Clostridiales bacterium]|jgi:protein-tyrosine phosphatase|nr:hypothetical protein [Clostridiales bacterium]